MQNVVLQLNTRFLVSVWVQMQNFLRASPNLHHIQSFLPLAKHGVLGSFSRISYPERGWGNGSGVLESVLQHSLQVQNEVLEFVLTTCKTMFCNASPKRSFGIRFAYPLQNFVLHGVRGKGYLEFVLDLHVRLATGLVCTVNKVGWEGSRPAKKNYSCTSKM